VNQWRSVHVSAAIRRLLHRPLESVAPGRLLDWLVGLGRRVHTPKLRGYSTSAKRSAMPMLGRSGRS
jgi:hypothetical protein